MRIWLMSVLFVFAVHMGLDARAESLKFRVTTSPTGGDFQITPCGVEQEVILWLWVKPGSSNNVEVSSWTLDFENNGSNVVWVDNPFHPNIGPFWEGSNTFDEDLSDGTIGWTADGGGNRTLIPYVWRLLATVLADVTAPCTRGTTDLLDAHGTDFEFLSENQFNFGVLSGWELTRLLTPDCEPNPDVEIPDEPVCSPPYPYEYFYCVSEYHCTRDYPERYLTCGECADDEDCVGGNVCACGVCQPASE